MLLCYLGEKRLDAAQMGRSLRDGLMLWLNKPVLFTDHFQLEKNGLNTFPALSSHPMSIDDLSLVGVRR